MRLIDGGVNEILPIREALNRARERALDLVEMTDKADPPVCKILNFRRFLYEKRQKEQRGHRQKKGLKELRFGPNISPNDLRIKIERAKEFLEEEHKVKVTVRYRGRQITHPEFGRAKLETFIKELDEVAKVVAGPRLLGKLLLVTLAPK